MPTNNRTQQGSAIFDTIEEGVLTLDRQLRVTYMNRAAEELFGHSRAAALGRPGAEILAIGPGHLQRLKELIACGPERCTFDTVVKSRERFLVMRVSATLLKDEEDEITGAALVIRGASQEIEVDRLKEEFLAIVSHEFRTPLTAVLGFTNLLLKGVDGDLSEKQRRHLAIINSNGKRLLELVNNLLTLSRLDGGLLTPEAMPTNLAMVVDVALGAIEFERNERRASVRKDLPTNLPMALVDPLILQQVLKCLLSNALKFTPGDGEVVVSAAVDVFPWSAQSTAEAVDCEIIVSVSDTGVGISPWHLEKIWEPFYQGDSSDTRQFGGVGLGLTVARRLVELSGGRDG